MHLGSTRQHKGVFHRSRRPTGISGKGIGDADRRLNSGGVYWWLMGLFLASDASLDHVPSVWQRLYTVAHMTDRKWAISCDALWWWGNFRYSRSLLSNNYLDPVFLCIILCVLCLNCYLVGYGILLCIWTIVQKY